MFSFGLTSRFSPERGGKISSLASLRGGGCRRARPAALRHGSAAPRRILAGLPFFCKALFPAWATGGFKTHRFFGKRNRAPGEVDNFFSREKPNFGPGVIAASPPPGTTDPYREQNVCKNRFLHAVGKPSGVSVKTVSARGHGKFPPDRAAAAGTLLSGRSRCASPG